LTCSGPLTAVRYYQATSVSDTAPSQDILLVDLHSVAEQLVHPIRNRRYNIQDMYGQERTEYLEPFAARDVCVCLTWNNLV
jgi:hypothetical protein